MTQRDRETIESDEKAFFSAYYKDHAYNSTGWRLRMERELGSLRRLSGQQQLGRVLSVGCGAGELELMLAGMAEHVTALDLSPEAIAIAQRLAEKAGISNIEFRCLSFNRLEWDQQFDAVLCIAFLHHVPEVDLPEFLQTAHQHITPSGFFYSQDPNSRGILRAVGRQVMGSSYHKFHTPDERELDPRKLTQQLHDAGFDEVRLRYIDLTLIPASFLLAGKPGWPLYVCAAVDWMWCRSPLAPWSSGFAAIARRK
jgi:cyclopropane fatty-acyl-phospholipid synthase-like methyltransferase